ncbi:MAG: NAD(P)/FAD-dependent oxidoreductase [Psychrobacter sp.]|nr:NAD(P)/FAD-dependent oxidoreductase [Psychrobacter sp.]
MKILDPIRIGNTTFKNRVLFPPLTTGYEDKEGTITEQSRAFYTRLAKGGVGYIVLGDVAPIRSFSVTPKLFDDSQIDSFKVLADSVHAYGAKIGVQIFHPEYDCDAINALFEAGEFQQMRAQLHHDMDHYVNEVTEEALMAIIDKMFACAKRAQRAGIDVINIHGDRLVGVLCSPIMNKRTDKFGGSLENRTRFALQLVRALKQAVPEMLIEYKLAVITPDRGKGGIEVSAAPLFAQWLVEAGVDMLHVAQANHTGNLADTIPPMGVQPYCFFADITALVKQAVTIPVSTSGRIIDPAMGEQLLLDGKADMIGIGRALLADPDWVNKTQEGRPEDICRCIGCNEGCVDTVVNRSFIACVVNAENGFEAVRFIRPAEQVKNVIVIGAGPAGMEAARVAAQKGHRVTLLEKETYLGGQLNIASVPPRKEELRRNIEDLTQACERLGVERHLGHEATAESVLALRPDAVIIAIGATSFTPPIEGINSPQVCDAWKVLAGEQQVTGRVAIVGGGIVGCETAEYLAHQGCQVSIIDAHEQLGRDIGVTVLPTMLQSFREFGVTRYPNLRVTQILSNMEGDKTTKVLQCQVVNRSNSANGIANTEVNIDCDYVVMATGARPLTFNTTKLVAHGIEVRLIGDCVKVKDISQAIKTGYDAANSL